MGPTLFDCPKRLQQCQHGVMLKYFQRKQHLASLKVQISDYNEIYPTSCQCFLTGSKDLVNPPERVLSSHSTKKGGDESVFFHGRKLELSLLYIVLTSHNSTKSATHSLSVKQRISHSSGCT